MDELMRMMEQEHMFIDYHQVEIADITRAVRTLITRFVSRINSRNNRFFIAKTIAGGSMVERTRIWENQPYTMIEFDFLALLQYRYESQHVAYGCPGHLKILNFRFSKGETGLYTMVEEAFVGDAVVQEFNQAILSSLYERCYRCRSSESSNYSQDLNVCAFCCPLKEETPSGWLELAGIEREAKGSLKPLLLTWHSKHLSLVKPWVSKRIDITHSNPMEITVLADFVPGFSFSRARIPEVFGYNFPNLPVDVEPPDQFYLVPKLCGKQHSTCWRISYCTTEVKSMQNTLQKHRDAYKMIKIFKNYALENTILSTYFMKSVVLRHIDHCTNDVPLIEPCLIEMLQYTLTCFRNNSLPHFVLGHDLFEGNVFFQNIQQEQVFLEKFQTLIDNLKSNKYLSMLLTCSEEKKVDRIKAVLLEIGELLKYHRRF